MLELKNNHMTFDSGLYIDLNLNSTHIHSFNYSLIHSLSWIHIKYDYIRLVQRLRVKLRDMLQVVDYISHISAVSMKGVHKF